MNYYYQILDRASCDIAIDENLLFADRIYNEGLVIQKYEDANEISDAVLLEKKKYVLLKTELWLNTILLNKKCNKPFHTIVYVYSQEPNSLKEAEQDAISNVLGEIKEERKNEVILLPIAGDLSLKAVDIQLRVYNITYFPSILIDENVKLEGFHEKQDIEKYLD